MVASIDVGAYEEPRERSKRDPKAWLLDNMPSERSKLVASLEEGVAVRVVVVQNERREIWVGTIVLRRTASVTLRLWGSGRLWTVRLEMILRAGVVPSHSFSEFEAACRNQRNGEPAGIETVRERRTSKAEGHRIELDDAVFQRVEDYAASFESSLERAFERLLSIGIRRLTALQKWEQKRHEARTCSSQSTKLG